MAIWQQAVLAFAGGEGGQCAILGRDLNVSNCVVSFNTDAQLAKWTDVKLSKSVCYLLL